MGHAHIVWVLLSAARSAVQARPMSRSWGAERAMRAGFETKQFIKFMCVHSVRIINHDRRLLHRISRG